MHVYRTTTESTGLKTQDLLVAQKKPVQHTGTYRQKHWYCTVTLCRTFPNRMTMTLVSLCRDELNVLNLDRPVNIAAFAVNNIHLWLYCFNHSC